MTTDTHERTIPWADDEMIGFGSYRLAYRPLRNGEAVPASVYAPHCYACTLAELYQRARAIGVEVKLPKRWRRAGR